LHDKRNTIRYIMLLCIRLNNFIQKISLFLQKTDDENGFPQP
jgi:hypothetical protein